MDILCFDRIIVGEPKIDDKEFESLVTLHLQDGNVSEFILRFSYEEKLTESEMPLYRIAAAMPLLNYGLFTREIHLDFPVSQADLFLLKDLNDVFARDILVNKLARKRTNYILDKYLDGIEKIGPNNLPEFSDITAREIVNDQILGEVKEKSCGILSSGGKESLMTYGMLKEIGADVHPIYVNESGGHWRTALTSYRYHLATDRNIGRVWTNVDRLYSVMLDNMKIIRPDHRRIRADTYPIRLCIFPVYVFALLPLFLRRGIGNLLIGSEFDDQRTVPEYNGIRHYYGVYDQTIDFDLRMEQWYSSRVKGMRQWSAVRPISGLIVERILVTRYPELARTQRSCHSCHFQGDEIFPCGKCSKCLGVMLFLKANKSDPRIMKFQEKSIVEFEKNLLKTGLRLDPDEYEHSRYLANLSEPKLAGHVHEHAESIHIHEYTNLDLIPDAYRKKLMKIIENHTNGQTELVDGEWKFI